MARLHQLRGLSRDAQRVRQSNYIVSKNTCYKNTEKLAGSQGCTTVSRLGAWYTVFSQSSFNFRKVIRSD